MRSILWSQIQQGESEMLSLLPQLIIKAWGNRAGLEQYLHGLYKASLECKYPSEIGVLLKHQAGNWSKWKWFWHHQAEPGEDILAERLMTALQRIDTYTEDFNDRIALRQSYLLQLEACVVGQMLTK